MNRTQEYTNAEVAAPGNGFEQVADMRNHLTLFSLACGLVRNAQIFDVETLVRNYGAERVLGALSTWGISGDSARNAPGWDVIRNLEPNQDLRIALYEHLQANSSVVETLKEMDQPGLVGEMKRAVKNKTQPQSSDDWRFELQQCAEDILPLLETSGGNISAFERLAKQWEKDRQTEMQAVAEAEIGKIAEGMRMRENRIRAKHEMQKSLSRTAYEGNPLLAQAGLEEERTADAAMSAEIARENKDDALRIAHLRQMAGL